ncbi:MAG: GGDEF domain-containing protein [Acidiferrobacter sp.]
MKSSLSVTKQGRFSPWRTVGVIALLILVVAASGAGLSLAWPRLWALFALLQAGILAPLVYVIAWRQSRAQIPIATRRAPMPSTGLVDDLTHTLNRRGITSSLIEAMAQAQRYNTPVSLTSLSVDGVEALIERLGDDAEAAILEAVAAGMGEVLRLPDRLGRYQDREFLVVLPQTRAEQATMVAERLRAAVANLTVAVKGEGATVTLSAGVAEFGRGQDLERFLANAHDALREAHKGGGNRVCVFKPSRAKGAS